MATPTVTLRQGTYRGVVFQADDRRPGLPKLVEAFMGIPYARVTERFCKAAPVSDGSEAHDATRYGQLCPSLVSRAEKAEGWDIGEDCLSVNVFRPADGAEGLPVVVYFHGGAFSVGKGADREMASFVGWADEDVLAVSFNYRLGTLGFLSCGVGEECGCLNLGLRDQRAALEWVTDNIGRFGGDPERVTAMGVSAGAHSIGHHMLSADPEKPLFQRAILESGAATARCVLSPSHERQETHFRELLAACGLAENLSPQDAIAALRDTPLSKLINAAGAVWVPEQSTLCWPFQPTIDGPGGIIPDLPVVSSTASKSYIPLITGFNTHEGVVFVDTAESDTPEEFREFFQTLIPGLSLADMEELEALYPDPADAEDDDYLPLPDGCGDQFPRLAAAYADQAYIAPVLHTAHRNARNGTPVYVYEFAAKGEPYAAANHGSEGELVARDVHMMEGHRGLVKVSERMHGLFSRFVALENSGSLVMPGVEGEQDVEWPAFESPFANDAGPDAGRILVFGQGNDERAGGTTEGTPVQVRNLTERELKRCKFWWDRMVLSQGKGERQGTRIGARI